MEKGTREGSVTKRKRKRETAKRVLELLEDKAKQQMQCSRLLDHTMKSIYYRLSNIQRILEEYAWECDANTHYQPWLSEDFTYGGKRTHCGTPANMISEKFLQCPITVFDARIPNVSVFQQYWSKQSTDDIPREVGSNVPFRPTSAPLHGRDSPFLGQHLQTTSPLEDDQQQNFGTQSGVSAASLSQTSSTGTGRQRPQTAPCHCLPKRDRAQQQSGGSAVTVAQRPTARGEPQVFSDKELEDVFDEVVMSDTKLESSERLFTNEYPDLNRDFEPKREYPLPHTPGQNYDGKFWEPSQFPDGELEKAFDVEEIQEVLLQPNEKLFMSEFPAMAGDWTPCAVAVPPEPFTQGISAVSDVKAIPAGEARSFSSRAPGEKCCVCGKTVPSVKVSPSKKPMTQSASSKSEPDGSAITIAQKLTRKPGEPQVFDDKELEHAFDEQDILDVKLEPDERLFMKEYPELDKNFEPNREYPLPHTPAQNVTGMFWESPQFSDRELEKVFDVEEISEALLQPNEKLFMKEFPALAGGWVPKSTLTSERTIACAAAGTGSPQQQMIERICSACGRKVSKCPTEAEARLLPQHSGGLTQPQSPAYKSVPVGSTVTVAEKHTKGAGEPQIFDNKELEKVFEEEVIPDVTLEPTERLFMKEYPELDKHFEPLRDYPLPHTPGQNYAGKFWDAQQFTEDELQNAFDAEEITEVDLQPNEKLFMKEFRALAGDWTPTNSAASANAVFSTDTDSKGPSQPGEQGHICGLCGKRKPV